MGDIKISICPYEDGNFEILFKNEDGDELTFSSFGRKKLTDEELEKINKIAPACMWTKYQRVTPSDE